MARVMAIILVLVILPAAHSLICMCSEGIGCGEDHMHHNLTCNTTGKCYKKIEWDRDFEVISYGCIPTEIQSHFSCKTDFSKHVKRRHGVLCCNSRDLCNSELEPTIPPTTAPKPSGSSSGPETADITTKHYFILFISAGVCTVVFGAGVTMTLLNTC